MTVPHIVPWPHPAVHDTTREGLRLGLIIGTATWAWVALVDLVAGQPFHTFAALGGVFVFTPIHYLLNIVLGLVLVSAIHGAERAPSLIFALIFGVLMFEGAFAMFTNILVQTALGSSGWAAILGGSLIGMAVAITLLSRTHPLAAVLHRAEEEK